MRGQFSSLTLPEEVLLIAYRVAFSSGLPPRVTLPHPRAMARGQRPPFRREIDSTVRLGRLSLFSVPCPFSCPQLSSYLRPSTSRSTFQNVIQLTFSSLSKKDLPSGLMALRPAPPQSPFPTQQVAAIPDLCRKILGEDRFARRRSPPHPRAVSLFFPVPPCRGLCVFFSRFATFRSKSLRWKFISVASYPIRAASFRLARAPSFSWNNLSQEFCIDQRSQDDFSFDPAPSVMEALFTFDFSSSGLERPSLLFCSPFFSPADLWLHFPPPQLFPTPNYPLTPRRLRDLPLSQKTLQPSVHSREASFLFSLLLSESLLP